ncbi:glycosyltransferase [uncultured Megamonas sp.]|uniref:glycosyltransferase family 32 protein n=1 Tax=uncultured Megamonas sp. TaxID=286140 RepID=UPI0025D29FB7|nr:glycosyltransferase [uncultured Megamonas sp.]
MIPKIIHYCWISENPTSELPEEVKKCINSWKKFLPDYKIVQWNLNNINIEQNRYMKEAYLSKKYAFVSDYIRLYALYNYGGIYLDTDVKVIKSFDKLLNNKVFMGFETLDGIATCVIGAEKESLLIKELLEIYTNRDFIKSDGNFDMTPNTLLIKPLLKNYSISFNNMLQKKDCITVYPIEYFCPLDRLTGDINITENTYAIHLFSGSWISKKEKERLILYRKYYTKLKKFCFSNLADFIAKGIATYNIEGYIGVKNRFFNKLKRLFYER